MMDIRRAAALLLALVMIAALTVGCGKKQSDTPTDTPADGHLPGYCRRDGADAAGRRPAGRRVLCHGKR